MKSKIIIKLPASPWFPVEIKLINPPAWFYWLIAIGVLLYLYWMIVI